MVVRDSMRRVPPPSKWSQFMEAGLSVLMLVATVLLIIMASRNLTSAPPSSASPRPATLPAEPVSIEGAATKGAPGARIVLIVYSDFECPFCARFARDVLPTIERDFVDTGRVRIAFRHLPLEAIHSNAVSAAEAVECAAVQGKFWPMHDLLFTDPKNLSTNGYVRYANDLGLRTEAFASCLTGEVRAKVMTDLESARALNLRTTPTLHIGQVEPSGLVRVVEQVAGLPGTEALGRMLDLAPTAAGSPR